MHNLINKSQGEQRRLFTCISFAGADALTLREIAAVWTTETREKVCDRFWQMVFNGTFDDWGADGRRKYRDFLSSFTFEDVEAALAATFKNEAAMHE